MDLQEHEQLIRDYKWKLRELRSLRKVGPADVPTVSFDGNCAIPISIDYELAA